MAGARMIKGAKGPALQRASAKPRNIRDWVDDGEGGATPPAESWTDSKPITDWGSISDNGQGGGTSPQDSWSKMFGQITRDTGNADAAAPSYAQQIAQQSIQSGQQATMSAQRDQQQAQALAREYPEYTGPGSNTDLAGSMSREQLGILAEQYDGGDQWNLGLHKDTSNGMIIDSANTREMTAEEYASLTDQERALVDFNTLMSQAITLDTGEDLGTPNTAAREEYDVLSANVFGEAQDVYAPNVVALLDAYGVDYSEGRIEDWLDSSALARYSDLDFLDGPNGQIEFAGTVIPESARAAFGTEGFVPPSGPGVREQFLTGLVDSIRQFNETYDADSINSRMAAYLNGDTASFSGSHLSDLVNPGSTYFSGILATVADTSSDGQWTYEGLQTRLEADGYTMEDFANYAGAALEQPDTLANIYRDGEPVASVHSADEILSMLNISRTGG